MITRINDFLTEAGTFFLATTDGDQPKLRPVVVFLILPSTCVSWRSRLKLSGVSVKNVRSRSCRS